MAYEERQNGTHAMTCDTPQCHHEILSPGRDELLEDLSLAGWVAVEQRRGGLCELFVCPHCSRGEHAGAAAMKRMFGTDEIQMKAPSPVHKGEPVHDEQGNLMGHYTSDAQQGDPVMVKLQFPSPQAPPSAVELYDEMLEGTDDDDDRVGRVSAVAPDGGVVAPAAETLFPQVSQVPVTAKDPAPVPRCLNTAAGESGSEGIVESAERPDLTTPEAKARLQRAPSVPRGPEINTAALDETAALFASLDPTISDWDPDDD